MAILKACQAARAALGGDPVDHSRFRTARLYRPGVHDVADRARHRCRRDRRCELLSFLVKIVKDIDAGVADVLGAAGGVAANTTHLNALLTTNDAVVEIKKEALRHAALVETL
jgi:hypothetical protein